MGKSSNGFGSVTANKILGSKGSVINNADMVRVSRSAKIRRGIYDFYYIDFNLMGNVEASRKEVMETLAIDIMDLYMNVSVDVFHADNSDYDLDKDKLTIDTIESVGNSIYSTLNRIREKTGKSIDIRLKIISDNINSYLYLFDNAVTNTTEMLFFKFDALTKVCTIYLWEIDPKEEPANMIKANFLSPIFASAKERNVTNLVGNSPAIFIAQDSIKVESFIDKVLTHYIDKYDEPGVNQKAGIVNDDIFANNSLELQLMNRIKDKKIDESIVGIYFYMITSWANERYKNNTIGMINKDAIDNFIMGTERFSAPFVDFSSKDLEFAHKYASKFKPFGGEEDINMVEIFENPKYGKELIFPVESENVKCLIYTSYFYNKEADELEFYMLIVSGSTYEIFAEVVYADFSKFRYKENTKMYQGCIMFSNSNMRFPSSFEDFNTKIPSKLIQKDIFLPMAFGMLTVYILLYMRPDRSRVIKETTLATSKPDQSNKKNQKGKTAPKKEYVVRRILKNTRDAKEYIRKVSEEGSPDREYTVEEWTRKEHERHYKNGKVVTIKQQTCHRNLPLSDKEIHIKL